MHWDNHTVGRHAGDTDKRRESIKLISFTIPAAEVEAEVDGVSEAVKSKQALL